MALIEEVFENNGKLYGGSTGREYSRSETEKIGYCLWSKPSGYQPDRIVIEVEPDYPVREPHEKDEKEY